MKISRILLILAVLVTALAGIPDAPRSQTRVYLDEGDAIARALQNAGSVRADTLRLSAAEVKALAEDLDGVVVDSIYVFHEAIAGDSVSRRAVVVNSIGQYQPITFMVALQGNGDVERVEIMVYRESRGGEVRRRAFLEQFEGKNTSDTIRVGDDIMNVTGATISSRSVANGVRLALQLQRLLLSR